MDRKLKHAVIVLAHDDLNTLVRLINGFDDDFDFYIHVDNNWSDFVECEMRKRIISSDRVALYSWTHVKWGSRDIVRIQMKLISYALSVKSYDYIHLMSGHDVLLKNCNEIKDFFSTHKGCEFMDYHQLPYSKWEQGSFARLIRFGLYDLLDYNKDKERRIIESFIQYQRKIGYKRNIPNHYPRLYGGSNWMSLTGNCWKYVLTNYKKSFLRRLRFTFAPDEVFFQTVVMNSVYAKNVTGNNLRLINWSDSGAVKTLTKYDWWNICKSEALFGRKVYSGISDELVEWIEQSRDMSGCLKSKLSDDSNMMRRLDYGIVAVLNTVVDSLKIRSSCEFLCKNGIYVRFLKDKGVKANGLDIAEEIPLVTRRLFPSGFHCQTVYLYEPISTNTTVDLTLVLVNWHVENSLANEIFIKNLVSVSEKYVLIRNEYCYSNKKDEMEKILKVHEVRELDNLIRKHGFVRNETVSQIISAQNGSNREDAFSWLFYERMI